MLDWFLLQCQCGEMYYGCMENTKLRLLGSAFGSLLLLVLGWLYSPCVFALAVLALLVTGTWWLVEYLRERAKAEDASSSKGGLADALFRLIKLRELGWRVRNKGLGLTDAGQVRPWIRRDARKWRRLTEPVLQSVLVVHASRFRIIGNPTPRQFPIEPLSDEHRRELLAMEDRLDIVEQAINELNGKLDS
ncbi:MAG: hypothetical protein C4521_11640 [Actinobacteria bacterium]|nr:MAG: hypothetical protein C4521_11640 [Actinomycetota bacterium]